MKHLRKLTVAFALAAISTTAPVIASTDIDTSTLDRGGVFPIDPKKKEELNRGGVFPTNPPKKENIARGGVFPIKPPKKENLARGGMFPIKPPKKKDLQRGGGMFPPQKEQIA